MPETTNTTPEKYHIDHGRKSKSKYQHYFIKCNNRINTIYAKNKEIRLKLKDYKL